MGRKLKTKSHSGHTFPWKLWCAVDDVTSDLFSWTERGDEAIVKEDRFEREILDIHPQLVRVKTFSNFRRQLRVYGFQWRFNTMTEFSFQHQNFHRDHPADAGGILSMYRDLNKSRAPKHAQRRTKAPDNKAVNLTNFKPDDLNFALNSDWRQFSNVHLLSGGGRVTQAESNLNGFVALPLPGFHPQFYQEAIEANQPSAAILNGGRHQPYPFMQAMPPYHFDAFN